MKKIRISRPRKVKTPAEVVPRLPKLTQPIKPMKSKKPSKTNG